MGASDISAPRYGSDGMPVTVRLPGALRDATGGETNLKTSGGTLREVIAEIDRRHPGFASRVLDEEGVLRSYVNVYIGEDDARTRGGGEAAGPGGGEGNGIPGNACGRCTNSRGSSPLPSARTSTRA